MKIIQQVEELQLSIREHLALNPNLSIGFVPTMGALHQGHIELVRKAKEKSDLVIVSIFVNPTQFNRAKDLETYPRNIEADADLLLSVGCDVLFAPTESEVYPDTPEKISVKLNGLDEVMEGMHRPGHFQGVLMVVKRLFDIVQPNLAFFGRKDFQQLMIIKAMVAQLKLEVEIVPVDIKRSNKGLALSSRNQLLSDQEKEEALILFNTLNHGRQLAKSTNDANTLKQAMRNHFKTSNLQLEYLSIVDNKTLKEVAVVDENCTICIAAYCGSVRLIDNVQIDRAN